MKGTMQGIFNSMTNLVSVNKFVFPSGGTNALTNFATGCRKLQHFIAEGVIGQNIAFPVSPLSVESMKSLIACLKDYSATGGTHTVTFKKDRETMLTAEEKAVATEKGWTLVWS